MKVLVIDVGGTHEKILAAGQRATRVHILVKPDEPL
jgi:hypothetical protein